MPYRDPSRFEGMVDGTLIPTWTILMKYDKLIAMADIRVVETLNVLQELIPIRFYRCRLDTFLIWLSKGKDAGLITIGDDHIIKHEMIHGCGGM